MEIGSLYIAVGAIPDSSVLLLRPQENTTRRKHAGAEVAIRPYLQILNAECASLGRLDFVNITRLTM